MTCHCVFCVARCGLKHWWANSAGQFRYHLVVTQGLELLTQALLGQEIGL